MTELPPLPRPALSAGAALTAGLAGALIVTVAPAAYFFWALVQLPSPFDWLFLIGFILLLLPTVALFAASLALTMLLTWLVSRGARLGRFWQAALVGAGLEAATLVLIGGLGGLGQMPMHP